MRVGRRSSVALIPSVARRNPESLRLRFNGEPGHVVAPRRQLERTDLLTDIEQGRKVEIALFRENTRSMDTLANLLFNRWFSKTEDIRLWEKRQDHVPEPVSQAGENPHRFPCEDPFCWRCEAGVKRLLRDCDLLPTGQPDRYAYTADAFVDGTKVAVRYRRDESDR